MTRKTDYLFQRPGSRNWWIKLQSPGNRVEKSLGTRDKKEAEIIALPMVAHHKAALLAARPRIETVWRYEYEPSADMQDASNGERVLASATELKFYGLDGKLLRTTSNGGPASQIVNLQHRLGIPFPVGERMIGVITKEARAKPKTDDDKVLETYIEHRKITGYIEREARDVWALFKTLTDGKPLKDCDRDDGRKLVAHFEAQGLKSATIEKKIAWLNAAVNLAIREGRLKFNPFASIVPRVRDKTRRLPLADADMKAIKRNLARLDEADQLLVRLLASTGMRLSEAFEIDGEEKERGVRYVIVGKKTEQSLRRVPLPAAVLPNLPKSIKGPLFDRSKNADPSDAASKRLNRFLDDCGIVDKRKVIHSFRHRAQDRLRAAECPEDIRWSILGHEEETVADSYGTGFSVPQLKKWIDKIGFKRPSAIRTVFKRDRT
jgi:integrase